MKVRPNIEKENSHARALSFYNRSCQTSKTIWIDFVFCIRSTIQYPDSSSTSKSSFVETKGRGHHRRSCPWKVVRLHFRTGLAPVCDREFVFQGPCSLNVLDTTVVAERLAWRSSGGGTNWPSVDNTMRMRSWTVCRSSCVIHPSSRMYRAKRFRGIADMDDCASKRIMFYGWKLHLQVTDQGLPMG
jgi:hypothetical protein